MEIIFLNVNLDTSLKAFPAEIVLLVYYFLIGIFFEVIMYSFISFDKCKV